MTTIGTDDGRNYARVNLKLVDRERAQRARRRRSSGDPHGAEADSRHRARRSASTGRSGSTCSAPIRETMTKLINEFAEKVAKIPGIADLEISEKAANPALSIRLNNDAAADLGITVQQVGATMRPLLAGDTVSYWLAPDGTELRGERAAAEGQPPARVRPRQPVSDDRQEGPRRRDADGAAAPGRRDRRDDEPADHQAAGAAAARRALCERRRAPVRRRQHGRAEDHEGDPRCRPATASTSAARRRTCRSRSRRRWPRSGWR